MLGNPDHPEVEDPGIGGGATPFGFLKMPLHDRLILPHLSVVNRKTTLRAYSLTII